MKMMLAIFVNLVALTSAAQANPLSKAIDLLNKLEATVTQDSADAKGLHEEEMTRCADRSKELAFEIKTGKKSSANYQAAAEKSKADGESASAKIEELAASISNADSELSAAQAVRDEEAAVFGAKEKESKEMLDTLSRAITILEREFSKGGAAMVQVQNAGSLAQAFAALEQASALSSADAKTLTALVQSSQQDDDADLSAPAAAAYESHSGSIVDTLEEMHEKATQDLRNAVSDETNAKHEFAMLKQSLEGQIANGNKDKANAQQALSESTGALKEAEGALARTNKDLAEDEQTLADLTSSCADSKANFETESKARADELTALAQAKKVLAESTGGAEGVSYAAASLLQFQRSQVSAQGERMGHEVLQTLRDLARKHRVPALAQLASRVASALHSRSAEGDVFKKVKSLIRDMVDRLQKEANEDATHKAYCDEQKADSSTKNEELTSKLERLTTKINSMSAQSKKLKGEQRALSKQLAELASDQANMDKIRKEQNALYTKNKADLEAGVGGVQQALKVLTEFYGSDSTSSGGQIIGVLEVVLSDFSNDLATTETDEESQKNDYDAETKQNSIDKATKEQDLKYKQKESAGLDKGVSELQQDASGVQDELSAVQQFMAELSKKCDVKAETYEEKTAARAAEIAGLKEALQILNGESLLQTSHSLRGVRAHQVA